MKEAINVIRCTCDVCDKSFDVKEEKDNPLTELVLPMCSYDESGNFLKVSADKVDVCEVCLSQMEKDISEHYDISTMFYVGVKIKRKDSVS